MNVHLVCKNLYLDEFPNKHNSNITIHNAMFLRNKDFISFDQYIGSADDIGEKSIDPEIISSCNFLLIDNVYPQIPLSHKICEQFKYLYDTLNVLSKSSDSKSRSLNKNDCSFLNYWLNNKLRINNNDPEICIKDFYQKLKNADNAFFNSTLSLDEYLHNIHEDHLENMKILNNLYYIKYKLHNILVDEDLSMRSVLCRQYTKECNKKYIEGIINCRNDGSYFYKAIKEFKEKYENNVRLHIRNEDNCQIKEFFELPDVDYVLSEYKYARKESLKGITTLPILAPIFGVFLMLTCSDRFSPFRQFLYKKIKRIKNMLMNTDDRQNKLLSDSFYNERSISNNEKYGIGYFSVTGS
ncbi:PIR Superfamily Protein [Plasmodium ovale curtisi]|uniref:PIR Superfamily Protein n=1 Tax=Plasmodium ovale curtisi TaxID=864141 RepID=A0A1A8WDF6_PLAOA|nr:PIR Superfamily Protein [Plasmodium ovale curtisi]